MSKLAQYTLPQAKDTHQQQRQNHCGQHCPKFDFELRYSGEDKNSSIFEAVVVSQYVFFTRPYRVCI